MSGRMLLAAALALIIAAPIVKAQAQSDQSNNSSGDRGNRGGGPGGRFDPSRFMDMIKERMNASDDEWKVIQPKLEKVFEARRDTGGMFGFRRDRGGDSSATRSPAQEAGQALRDVLDKKDATAEEIQAKLTA